MPYRDLQKRKKHDRRTRLIINPKDKKKIINFFSSKYFLLNKNEETNTERYYAFAIRLRLIRDKEIDKVYFDKYFHLTGINILKDIRPLHRYSNGEIKEVEVSYDQEIQ